MKLLNKIRWINIYVGLLWLRKTLKHRVVHTENDFLLPETFRMVNRIDYILATCSGKNVLHFGFADYPYTQKKLEAGNLLHLQLRGVAKSVYGIDHNEESIRAYTKITRDDQVGKGDLFDKESLELNDKSIDIILLGEILEHVKNPHQVIENIYEVYPSSTLVLVTVPNYTSLNTLSASLHHTEMIHPDHYWFFSPVTLLRLFSNDKFEIQDLCFGMYFEKNRRINFVLQQFPFLGDCIIALFKRK